MKEGVAEGQLGVGLVVTQQDPRGGHYGGGGDDDAEPAKLVVVKELLAVSAEGEVEQREVGGADEHAQDDDILRVGGMPVGEAIVFGGIASGGYGGHGVVDGVEEVHRADPEQEDESCGNE